jgi:tRNA (guanine-N7-)-methyltransferase
MSTPDPDRLIVAPASIEGSFDFARLFDRADGPGRPVEIEIGCGKGRFLLAAAKRWPGHDFLAVEQVRSLVRNVRDKIVRQGVTNVRLHHGNAKDALTRLVPDASVHRLHVYFPDPWPKRRHAKHRLFAGEVAPHVARVLAPGGQLLLATDFDPYFREAVATFAADPRLVRVLPDPFAGIPRGGFDAIFAARNVPVFRGIWERLPPP